MSKNSINKAKAKVSQLNNFERDKNRRQKILNKMWLHFLFWASVLGLIGLVFINLLRPEQALSGGSTYWTPSIIISVISVILTGSTHYLYLVYFRHIKHLSRLARFEQILAYASYLALLIFALTTPLIIRDNLNDVVPGQNQATVDSEAFTTIVVISLVLAALSLYSFIRFLLEVVEEIDAKRVQQIDKQISHSKNSKKNRWSSGKKRSN